MEKVAVPTNESSKVVRAAAEKDIKTKDGKKQPEQIPQIQFKFDEGKYASSPIIQSKLTIGQPNDKYEQEADRIADRVMTMPEPIGVQRSCASCTTEELQTKPIFQAITPFVQRQPLEDEEEPIQTKIAQRQTESAYALRSMKPIGEVDEASADEEDGEEPVQAKTNNDSSQAATTSIENNVNRSKGQGVLLPDNTRSFMESRFGADFGHVRVHNDDNAVQLNKQLNSQAFTKGSDIYFNSGKYNPGSSSGKHLLAHELTHVVQQKSIFPKIQRRLSVNPNHPTSAPTSAPASDPAASLTSAQRFSMMNNLIRSLCDKFEVDPVSGDVQSTTMQSLDPAILYAGTNRTGCCCLNILTNGAGNWTIDVSQVVGPRTIGNHVVLSPTNTPIEFGSYTSAGTLAFQGQVPAAGHELCGHAALMEVNAHPPPQSRMTTDVHDPTVNIENAISSEQGVPAAEMRGLAASGTHRGESVDKITIRNYPFNGTNVPAGELGKLQFAASYIVRNDSYVDILGHSDSVGANWAKQAVSLQRALKVKQGLRSNGVLPTITGPAMTPVPRFTRVEGMSDTQPPPPPLAANQDNWRRVEILIAGYPAGAQNPPAGTPTTVAPHVRNPNVSTQRSSTDLCIRHLVRTAYP